MRNAAVIGVVLGGLYGVLARLVAASDVFGPAFLTLTVGFLVFVPVVIGYLTVYPVEQPTWVYRTLMPWLPCALAIAAAGLVGWEGSICIIMSTPLLLVLASIGGIIAAAHRKRRLGHAAVVAMLPFIIAPIESRLPQPTRLQRNVTEIVVDAPASAVWQQVITVPTIQPHEQRDAFYLRLGFPRPISAELSRPGVGGIRHARFAGNVLFIETITHWEDERRIAFMIDAQTDSIPATTLDPHVTIGGEYFDVLRGEYQLIPVSERRTRVLLTSDHRVSTRLNFYSDWWAGIIMRSIQRNILQVIRARAEAAGK